MAFETVLDGPTNYNVSPALNFFLGNAHVIKVETTTAAQDDRVSKMKVSSYIEVYFTTETSTNLFLLIKNGGSGLLEFATPKVIQKCYFRIINCNL